jgi:CheY-like chemotaxis protein
LVLRWSEHGGPNVVEPSSRGFGSRLITLGLGGAVGGSVQLDFEPTGVVCTVTAPLAGLARMRGGRPALEERLPIPGSWRRLGQMQVSGVYVLVVEDEPILRLNAVDMLDDAGFEVLEAADADAALRLLEERAPEVAALFTDINMPGSMDGLALAKVVHERWPHIQPFVTSGRSRLHDAEIPDHGRFIAKPYRSAEMVTTNPAGVHLARDTRNDRIRLPFINVPNVSLGMKRTSHIQSVAVGLALAGVAYALGRALTALTVPAAPSGRPADGMQRSRSVPSRQPASTMPSDVAGDREYVRYHPGIETVEPDEATTFDRIIDAMAGGGKVTRERYGRSVRTSHAKAHGLLKGELRVLDSLPPELRQGLFALPRTYPAIVRLAHVPGELLDDRKVSTPRGLALKILDMQGEMLPGHKGEATQDWVLDTGKVFIAPGAKTFLAQITATEAATSIPEGAKAAVSTVSRATNAALNAIGLNSANLDFYGHPRLHPLGEAYYSQCAMRYGDYIAKLGVFPDTSALKALIDSELDIQDENGLRNAVVEFFRTHPAEYVIAIQLCTDLDRMPVENATVEWPEDESPYRPVARLILPPQDAYSPSRVSTIDEDLLFCPAHSLAAHRPLGSIMRARMKAYEVLGNARRQDNGRPVKEPRSLAEIPD